MSRLTRRQLLLGAAAALVVAGCQGTSQTPPAQPTTATGGATTGGSTASGRVKIVSSLPLQGANLAVTKHVVNAIKLAVDEIGGKVGNLEVVYESMDDSSASNNGNWTADQEKANANKAVADPDVMVYIGTFNSGAARVAIPILNQAGIVMISPANTAVDLTKTDPTVPGSPGLYRPSGKNNYFRVVPADDIQGPVQAQWAQELGVKKVYILHDQEAYGKGLAEQFEKKARELNLEIVGSEGIRKDGGYKTIITKAKSSAADLIFFGGITGNNAPQIVKDMKEVGINAKFMGGDGLQDSDFTKAIGKDGDGIAYATNAGGPVSQLKGKGADFYKNYKAKFTADGEPEAYAAYGYEAASVALAAIKAAGKKDRAAILQAVTSTKDFDGILGKWSFDERGDTTLTSWGGYQVKDGKWEFVGFKELKK